MYSLNQLRKLVSCGRDLVRSLPLRRGFLLILLILLCAAFAPQTQAITPAPDGCYPGLTTAEGCFALYNLTSGTGNTGLGRDALFSDTSGSWNTAVGAAALGYNNADFNTALGAAALLLNDNGTRNTAVGTAAMFYNEGGPNSGDGSFNDALGTFALMNNTSGACNVALGDTALMNSTTGDNNIAIGCDSGSSITTGSNNIYIGNIGVDDESNTIRIGDPTIIQNAYIAGIPAGGLAAILFDYNSGAVTINVGGPVPFSQAPLIVGTAISKASDTTFTVNKNGVYRVTYTLRTALVSLLANVQVHVNGAGVGPTAALIVAGTSLSDQVTFAANTGDTIQLVVGGVALNLGTGDNATINIDKVQ